MLLDSFSLPQETDPALGRYFHVRGGLARDVSNLLSMLDLLGGASDQTHVDLEEDSVTSDSFASHAEKLSLLLMKPSGHKARRESEIEGLLNV